MRSGTAIKIKKIVFVAILDGTSAAHDPALSMIYQIKTAIKPVSYTHLTLPTTPYV